MSGGGERDWNDGTQAVNVPARLYMDVDGTVWPIIKFFGRDGDPCESWEEPCSAVAGEGGDWFAISLADFEGKPS